MLPKAASTTIIHTITDATYLIRNTISKPRTIMKQVILDIVHTFFRIQQK